MLLEKSRAKDAAAYLKRGKVFVLREIHAGRLRAARIGGRGEILTRLEMTALFHAIRT
jgi:excisionase family DNA binding protein